MLRLAGDGDGQRVKKVDAGGTTVYVGNYYEVFIPGPPPTPTPTATRTPTATPTRTPTRTPTPTLGPDPMPPPPTLCTAVNLSRLTAPGPRAMIRAGRVLL